MGVEMDEERTQSPDAQSVLFGEIPEAPEARKLMDHIIRKAQENEADDELESMNRINSTKSTKSYYSVDDQPAVITIETEGKWKDVWNCTDVWLGAIVLQTEIRKEKCMWKLYT